MALKDSILKNKAIKANKDNLSVDVSTEINEKPTPEASNYKPDELVTISTKELNKIETANNTVSIYVSLSLDLDDALIDFQKDYRRKNAKKISKEDIILSVLNKHFFG